MRKRVIKMLLCGMILTMFVTGCEGSDAEGEVKDIIVQQDNSLRFQPTGNSYVIDGRNWREYVDTKTNNLYMANGSYYIGGITPLYNENGEIAKYTTSEPIDTQGVVN